jgi:hypothetical protein
VTQVSIDKIKYIKLLAESCVRSDEWGAVSDDIATLCAELLYRRLQEPVIVTRHIERPLLPIGEE